MSTPFFINILCSKLCLSVFVQIHHNVGRSSPLLPRIGETARIERNHIPRVIDHRTVRVTKHHNIIALRRRFPLNIGDPRTDIVIMSMRDQYTYSCRCEVPFPVEDWKKSHCCPQRSPAGHPAISAILSSSPSASPRWIRRSIGCSRSKITFKIFKFSCAYHLQPVFS